MNKETQPPITNEKGPWYKHVIDYGTIISGVVIGFAGFNHATTHGLDITFPATLLMGALFVLGGTELYLNKSIRYKNVSLLSFLKKPEPMNSINQQDQA
ncbi:hypothetical protein C4579_02770 [Candidatus Microgenomates bacterium]|nr:MAG: hypothetical protein C4579_02770 [Candidatus Microgenomates bacterium]